MIKKITLKQKKLEMLLGWGLLRGSMSVPESILCLSLWEALFSARDGTVDHSTRVNASLSIYHGRLLATRFVFQIFHGFHIKKCSC
jgi:hypothetical protein